VGAVYTKQGFDGLSEAFDPDNALLIAWAKVQVAGPLYLTGTFTRTWQVQPDRTYASQDNYSAGVGVSFAF